MRFNFMHLLGPALLVLASHPSHAEGTGMRTCVDLEETVGRWTSVDDDVMGGISSSRATVQGASLVFEGTVSLENNGGFASTRLIVEPGILEGADGIAVLVSGGGRSFQLRLRTDARFDGVAYRATFQTPSEGAAEIRIPFASFQPTWRGRVLRDVGPLDPGSVRQLGFLIADGQEGPFRLQVDAIGLYDDAD